jgi:transcriptional regulator with XRE-family HTH domain
MTPRRFLGKELCRARLAAGFSSQQALADHLGFERTTVAKAESGDRVPSDPVLTAWAAACDIDIEHYQRLAELARAAEGPVQQTDTSDEAIDALVNARLDRQAIFDRADPPDVTAVLDEAVLHRLIGTPAVMHDVLVHVAEMALRPFIVVQVVPAAKGANAGIGGAFDIASADGSPDTLRTDGVEDQTTETRLLVRKHKVAFNRVRGDALSRDASRDLILEAAEHWKTT